MDNLRREQRIKELRRQDGRTKKLARINWVDDNPYNKWACGTGGDGWKISTGDNNRRGTS